MRDEGFREFVEDQLAQVRDVVCRPMFGGHGLYSGDMFFGIIYQAQLYFKTDAATRQRYIERGMRPFRPSAKQTLRSYYGVPPDILEDGSELVEWVEEAIHCKRDTSSPAQRRRGRR